jgi:hypothetical protein
MAKITDRTRVARPLGVDSAGGEDRPDSFAKTEAALGRVRNALPGAPPGDTLAGRCDVSTGVALPAVGAFLVRCHARVGFLAALHPTLGTRVRLASLVGLGACLLRDGADQGVAAAQWIGTVSDLEVLTRDSPDPSLGCGPGQAGLVAADLLRAVARGAEFPPSISCRRAAEDVLAAFWASSPAGTRDIDRARVVDALGRDLDVMAAIPDGRGCVDPGPAGPFGPLWRGDAPFLPQSVAPASPSALLPKLTDLQGCPILARMAGELSKRQGPRGAGEPGTAGDGTGSSDLTGAWFERTPDLWLEALRELRGRVTRAAEPFREDFLALLAAVQGRSFSESNAAAAAEINTLLALLGLQLRDPDNPEQAVYLRCKQAHGTLGGAFEIRSHAGGKQQTIWCRTKLPDRLLVQSDPACQASK